MAGRERQEGASQAHTLPARFLALMIGTLVKKWEN